MLGLVTGVPGDPGVLWALRNSAWSPVPGSPSIAWEPVDRILWSLCKEGFESVLVVFLRTLLSFNP